MCSVPIIGKIKTGTRDRHKKVVQGSGNKEWNGAGGEWVDFGQKSGTLQPNCLPKENMSQW